jgi:hypothetical protein
MVHIVHSIRKMKRTKRDESKKGNQDWAGARPKFVN